MTKEKLEEKRQHLLAIGPVVVPVVSRQSSTAEPHGYSTRLPP